MTDAEFDRKPPESYEAEAALLGILLYDPDSMALISGLAGVHFYEPIHGVIFDTIAADIVLARSPDPLTVWDQIKHIPAMVEIGGVRYLADLVDRAPPSRSIGDYARIIGDGFAKRSMSTLLNEATRAISQGMEIDEVSRRLTEGVASIENATSTDESWVVTAQEATEDVVDALSCRRPPPGLRDRRYAEQVMPWTTLRPRSPASRPYGASGPRTTPRRIAPSSARPRSTSRSSSRR